MALNIIYAGVDITDRVEVTKADIHDHAGGKADSLELAFADPLGLWSEWKPQKGEEISVTESGFGSGKMYIDELGQSPGLFVLRAMSTPLASKSPKTRSWEKIRFLKLANDLVTELGLTLQTYDVGNWLYNRIEQNNVPNLEMLRAVCVREGYVLKITDGKAVIYDERKLEKAQSVLTIYGSDIIGDYGFKDASSGLKQSCQVRYLTPAGEFIQHEFRDPNIIGGNLPINERVNDRAEADRFAKGYLRSVNKWEKSGTIAIKLNTNITAGNVVEIAEVGMADGLYFIDKAVHRLTHDRTVLTLRKPLEGY